MTYARKLTLVSCSILAASFLGRLAGAAEAVPGLSQERPVEGRCVETDRGFMVPYTVTIPGTEVTFRMEPVPGGRFRLGSPPNEPDRGDEEGPVVAVEIAPFWAASQEVTWAEYKVFMKLYKQFKKFQIQQVRLVDEKNRIDAVTAPTELYDPTFTFEYGDDPRLPAVTMTQYAAKQYTKWLSGITGQQFRLPGEAEWEYACRAGTTTAYSFGDDPAMLDEYAWHEGNADGVPHPVGEKKPNPWGLYDMHGGVWEWCIDQWLADGYARLRGQPVQGLAAVAWPTTAYPRVVRGGSWESTPEQLRCAAKLGSDDPAWKESDPNLPLSPWWFTSDPARGVGFRLVRSLHDLPPEQIKKFHDVDVEEIQLDVEARLQEGRGVLGLVDRDLPAAAKKLEDQ